MKTLAIGIILAAVLVTLMYVANQKEPNSGTDSNTSDHAISKREAHWWDKDILDSEIWKDVNKDPVLFALQELFNTTYALNENITLEYTSFVDGKRDFNEKVTEYIEKELLEFKKNVTALGAYYNVANLGPQALKIMRASDSVFGIVPVRYFYVITEFALQFDRLFDTDLMPNDTSAWYDLISGVAVPLNRIHQQTLPEFRRHEDQIHEMNVRYKVEEYFEGMWHAYTTYWRYMKPASRDNLLNECKKGGLTKIILGIDYYLQYVEDSFFMKEIKERNYTVTSYREIQQFLMIITSQAIHINAFCYGIEGVFVGGNDVIVRHTEDNNKLVEIMLEYEPIVQNSYWREGVENFVCQFLVDKKRSDLKELTHLLLSSLKKHYGGFGDKFAVVFGKHSGMRSDYGFVIEDSVLSLTVNLTEKNSSYQDFIVGGRQCKSMPDTLDIVIFRVPHVNTINDGPVAETTAHLKRLESQFNKEFMTDAIALSLASAIDTVRIEWNSTEPMSDCLYHYITRGQVRESYGLADWNETEYNFYQNTYVHSETRDQGLFNETFQVFSMCRNTKNVN